MNNFRTNLMESLDGLELKLSDHVKTRRLALDQDIDIRSAIFWLKSVQNKEGYWGEKCLLDTQLTLLAISTWMGNYPDPTFEKGVDQAFSWLSDVQRTNGSWEDNIWDTSVIIQVAAKLGRQDNREIRSALDWLIKQERTNWGLDLNLGAHYLAQVVIAFDAVGADSVVNNKAITLLENAIQSNNQVNAYVGGQVVTALAISGSNLSASHMQNLVEKLVLYLKSADVTIANWLHLCSALRGMGFVLGAIDTADQSGVGSLVTRIFNPARRRTDGSWYRSVSYTAWTLLALDGVATVKQVQIPLDEVVKYIQSAKNTLDEVSNDIELEQSSRKEKRWRLYQLGVSSTFLIVFILAVFGLAVYPVSWMPLSEGVLLTVSAILIPGLLYLARLTIKNLREG